MLRVPAWKSVVWPHEYDLISNSMGSRMSCCQRGEALELGMDTGYSRKRQLSSPSVEDSGYDGVVLPYSGAVGDGICTEGSVVSSIYIAVLGWEPVGHTGGGTEDWRRAGRTWRYSRN
jgi:hypothetical protein